MSFIDNLNVIKEHGIDRFLMQQKAELLREKLHVKMQKVRAFNLLGG
jgi:hypothetical protein